MTILAVSSKLQRRDVESKLDRSAGHISPGSLIGPFQNRSDCESRGRRLGNQGLATSGQGNEPRVAVGRGHGRLRQSHASIYVTGAERSMAFGTAIARGDVGQADSAERSRRVAGQTESIWYAAGGDDRFRCRRRSDRRDDADLGVLNALVRGSARGFGCRRARRSPAALCPGAETAARQTASGGRFRRRGLVREQGVRKCLLAVCSIERVGAAGRGGRFWSSGPRARPEPGVRQAARPSRSARLMTTRASLCRSRVVAAVIELGDQGVELLEPALSSVEDGSAARASWY